MPTESEKKKEEKEEKSSSNSSQSCENVLLQYILCLEYIASLREII
jgi:hypothetical protein